MKKTIFYKMIFFTDYKGNKRKYIAVWEGDKISDRDIAKISVFHQIIAVSLNLFQSVLSAFQCFQISFRGG